LYKNKRGVVQYAPKVRQNTFKTTLTYEIDIKAQINRSKKKLTVNYGKPAFFCLIHYYIHKTNTFFIPNKNPA